MQQLLQQAIPKSFILSTVNYRLFTSHYDHFRIIVQENITLAKFDCIGIPYSPLDRPLPVRLPFLDSDRQQHVSDSKDHILENHVE